MKIVELIDIILDSSTITEGYYEGDAVSVWTSGATFALDQFVYDTRTAPYKVYKSKVGSNVGNDPVTSTDNWTWYGYTDRWAMFDEFTNTQSQDTTSFEVEIDASRCNYVGLFNLQAETIDLVHIVETELATAGDCSSDSLDGGDGWSYDSGNTQYDCDGTQTAVSDLDQDGGIVDGVKFQVQTVISNYSAGNLAGAVGGSYGDYEMASNGTHTQIITAGSSGKIGVSASADFVGSVDSVSIKKVPKEETIDLGSMESVSYYEYCFGVKTYKSTISWEFPRYSDATIRATLNWKTGEDAKCGSMMVGKSTYLGGTLYNPDIDLLSYAIKSTDATTGNTTLVPNDSTADEFNTKIYFLNNKLASVRKKFKSLDGIRVIFDFNNPGVDYETLIILGFFIKFSTTIRGPNESRATIKSRSLI